MKDEAGNLIFDFQDQKFKLPHFNWRKQREVLVLLAGIQNEDGNTQVTTDEAIKVQDRIFNMLWLDNARFDESAQDRFFDNVTVSTNLFTEFINVALPFLTQGSEASAHQASAASQDKQPESTATGLKRKPTSG